MNFILNLIETLCPSLQTAKWLAPVVKWASAFIALGAAIFFIRMGVDHEISTLRKEGFNQAQQQYTAEVNAANAKVSASQEKLNIMTSAFDKLAGVKTQALSSQIAPIQERVTNEVTHDVRYRECVISDSMLHDIQAAHASVDLAIAPSTLVKP